MRYIIITNCNGFPIYTKLVNIESSSRSFPVTNDLHVIIRNASFTSFYLYISISSRQQNAIIWREKSVKYTLPQCTIIYRIIAIVILFHSHDVAVARLLVDCVARISRYVESLLEIIVILPRLARTPLKLRHNYPSTSLQRGLELTRPGCPEQR